MSEPDELLIALRAAELDYTLEWGSGDLYGAAADEIERLRAVIAAASQGEPPEHYTDENYRVEPVAVSGELVWKE
jgi:hypothetical protein